MRRCISSEYYFFRLCRFWVLLSFITLFAQKISAQTDTSRSLREVSVKANVIPVLKSQTPAQQITSADFVKYGAFNVADAVRSFSGVNIKDYGGIGGIKTISVRGLASNHTAVFYDGLQINDAQTGQIDLSKLNLSNIDKITLYNAQPDDLLQHARAFAFASVLDITTKTNKLPSGKTTGITAGIKSGSFGLFNPFIQLQQHINNNWYAVLSTNYINSNGRYKYKVEGDGSDTLATRRHSEVRSFQTDAALYWHKSDSSTFNIHLNYYNAKRGLPGAVVYYSQSPGENLDNDDVFVQASYKHIWRNSLQLLLNSKLSQLKTRYLDSPYFNTQGFILQHYKQQEAYQSATVTYNIKPFWVISYAADASVTKVNADIERYAYPTRFTLLNVIASNIKLNRWEFSGNLLYTYLHESVKRGSALQQQPVLSPTVVASFRPLAAANLTIRAFYKNIFRYPTLDELYYFAFAERIIKPEFVKQYDLGATYSKNFDGFVNYISLNADAYYNNVHNKIIALPNQNPAVFSYSNVGEVDIKGIDFGFKAASRRINNLSLSFAANYTYQDALDVSDSPGSNYLEQIPYTPKNTLALNAGINYKRLSVYYNQVLSSHRNYNGSEDVKYRLPGYSVSDASAVYDIQFNKLPVRLSAEANNIFNKYYSIIRSYPMPGRSYRFSIQVTI
ncbi:TonB-dependent receptor plug domain-containing protein [Mucilaginibacter litoreus]|uniref:TonB-dependent receptor plug domain-containing protein n=1 Tax=Mucilaginibacter litoreus TaxID=1048221 RepID=A0ABW3ASL9_9SPHI